jgi:exosortase E/protease (VPEID-CTERM system)
LIRWIFLTGLLLAEVIFLTVRFDAGSLADNREWWADLVRQARFLPQLGMGLAMALLVFGGPEWGEELRRLSAKHARAHNPWLFLAGHLIALGGVVQLTRLILEGDISSNSYPGAWVVAWLALGAVALAFWGGAMLPPGLWLALARGGIGPLFLGLCLSIAALEAGWLTLRLWQPLGEGTVWLVYHFLAWIYPNTLSPQPDPTDPENFFVGTSTFHVRMAPHCSGYEGIGLTWVFLLFFLWVYRREVRFPHVLLLFPLGTAFIWLANAARITGLIIIGMHVPKISLAGFHSQAGWLAFDGVALGLLALVRYCRYFAVPSGPSKVAQGSGLAVPYLAPLFVTLAATSIGTTLSAGFDWLYPLRVVAAAVALWLFWRHYPDLRWRRGWAALGLGSGMFLLWLALAKFGGLVPAPSPWSAAVNLPRGYVELWLVFRVLGYVVTTPLVEELAFRGFLIKWLLPPALRETSSGQFTWLSFVGSSVAFGCLHSSSWLAGTLAGAAYALALYRRGRLADAVWAHTTTNALLTVYVLATGDWALWN